MVNVREFGALGDNRNDDYEAIQRALNSGDSEIAIPQGIYLISKTLLVPSDTKIIADPTAKLVLKGGGRKHRGDFLLSNADTVNGNRNIQIIGGIWDGNNHDPANAKPDIFGEQGFSGALMNFSHVHGLVLKNLVLANSTTYYVRMGCVHDFEIEDISFISDTFGRNQDGLHFGGDCKHGKVKNIRALSFGQTNDDLIALNADDSVVRVENRDLVCDDIEDIVIENIYAESCHTIIRLLSVHSAIRNVHFKNVYGGFRCYAVNADGARYCATPLFKEEDHPHGVGCIENVTIEDFTCYRTPVPAEYRDSGITPCSNNPAIQVESNTDAFSIRNFRMLTKEENAACALQLRNLENQVVLADGVAYTVKNKGESLELPPFASLRINKI